MDSYTQRKLNDLLCILAHKVERHAVTLDAAFSLESDRLIREAAAQKLVATSEALGLILAGMGCEQEVDA